MVSLDGGVSEEAFALKPGDKEIRQSAKWSKILPTQDAGNIAPSNLRMIPSF